MPRVRGPLVPFADVTLIDAYGGFPSPGQWAALGQPGAVAGATSAGSGILTRPPIWRTAMQADIHPNYELTTVVCSCGNTFTTRSTKTGSIHVELCNECHPFFTGKQKLVDSGGRVERFQRRYGQRKGSTKSK
jgi:large subunit ribosomal protein L31